MIAVLPGSGRNLQSLELLLAAQLLGGGLDDKATAAARSYDRVDSGGQFLGKNYMGTLGTHDMDLMLAHSICALPRELVHFAGPVAPLPAADDRRMQPFGAAEFWMIDIVVQAA